MGWDLSPQAGPILKDMSIEWKRALVSQIKQQDPKTIELFKDRYVFLD